MGFILASESARRVELLSMMGFDFEPRVSGFPEVTLEDPLATAEKNARGKALALCGEGVVLAADTVVYLPRPSTVFGQATGEEDVRRMLSRLQGNEHEVYTAVAVAQAGSVEVRHAVTRVRMCPLSREEVEAYVMTGEGVGKAGGYAIQGRAAIFVEAIEGEYTNVVGLPLSLTGRMLRERGIRWY